MALRVAIASAEVSRKAGRGRHRLGAFFWSDSVTRSCRVPTVRAMTRQRTLAIVALLASSALCVATVEIRTHETGDPYYRFLVWNLILAWVPLAFAIAAYARARGRIDLLVAVLLVPWLLFFPNAPVPA